MGKNMEGCLKPLDVNSNLAGIDSPDFLGEGLILEPYCHLQSIDPENPLLNSKGHVEQGHFHFKPEFCDESGKPRRGSFIVIHYMNELNNEIEKLGYQSPRYQAAKMNDKLEKLLMKPERTE